MKRVKAILASALLVLLTLAPMGTAKAATNLVANPSFETASGTAPANWTKGNWGTNTAKFTYEATGHTGSRSATVALSGYKSGDAKWFFNPITASSNTAYTFSDWYKSTVATEIDAVVTTTTGTTAYYYVGNAAASTAWKQANFNFTTPANTKNLTFYHVIYANGSLTTDDTSLTGPETTPPVTPTAPAVSVTAPANNATVSGTATVTANASDAVAVTSVQFKLDGVNLGAADTTAPYSVSWDSKTATNGTHTLTAVATNNSNLTTTSTAVTVNVNNVAAPTAPTVAFSAPAANSTVSGTTAVTATASDAVSVTNVQFKVDGTVVATVATAPYTYNWDTKTVANGSHNLTAVATNSNNLTTTVTEAVTVNNIAAPTAPTVAFAAPAANSTLAGTAAITANASDAVAVTSVQLKVDNTVVATLTAAPYTYNWDTKTATNGNHTLTAVATNNSNLTTTVTETVVVNNPTAPTVSITAPAANATVSGTVNVTANASDAVAVTSVQFKLDGVNLGAADTTAPYSVSWDSKTVVNGTHTLTAVATNGANLSTTATTVTVTVNNVVTPPAATNLISNPSFETATNGLPNDWSGDGWGTNNATKTYENTGHTGGHSVKVSITTYTDGDAKWMFKDVAITAGKNYQYSNWYMSSVDSEIDAQVTATDGTVSYYYVATVPASSTWAQVKAQFTAPANAKSISMFQPLAKAGWIQTDDYSFAEFTPTALNRAIVTLTFDDGWRSQYTNGLPLLQKYHMPGTFYIISGVLGDPDYMTNAMLQTIKGGGNEIADHTVSHPHLPTLTVAQLDQEFGNSQTTLRNLLGNDGVVASNLASPYGEYNATVLTEAKKYFRSHRSTDDGYNSKDNFDIYNIKVQNIVDATTPAQVAAWVAQAQADKTWLVLVYHPIGAPDTAQEDYGVTTANFETELQQLQASGVSVQTLNSALNEIVPQL
ncbi:MAG TPA: Ig-like domain-containing protein [Bacillota bacterium]|nr:Ig-like domain-containing protein [Bacillota bacterium]